MLKFLDFFVRIFFEILIFLYKLVISPVIFYFFGNTCRFHPTCSQYSLEAFRNYPSMIALYLTIKRISRCNPFNEGGVDHLPDLVEFKFMNKNFTFHSKNNKN